MKHCEGLTFDECELTILRLAVDEAEKNLGENIVKSPEVKFIIQLVEEFIKDKQLLCYGGSAINNILPLSYRFYDKDYELPDYDFYSTTPMEDAKELADIYFKEGFKEVEAKSGSHPGTYKVFVNFIPIADITYLDKFLFKELKKNAIRELGIYYAPPNFLKMAMFIELSRPKGDVSRWEKVLKRLIILNKVYPIMNKKCNKDDFQRKMVVSHKMSDKIYESVKSLFIDLKVVFFGGFAISVYSKYMPIKISHKNPDFDVLAEEPERVAQLVKEKLKDIDIHHIDIVKHEKIGELIGEHYEVKVGNETICFIYAPVGCHSYNELKQGKLTLRIATIDTILSFYLAFLYINKPYYYDKTRFLCMSEYLFNVQQHNRLSQKGVLKRFSTLCIGTQETLEEIKESKSKIYQEYKNDKNSLEFQKYFFRYRPSHDKEINHSVKEVEKRNRKYKYTKKRKIRNTKTKRKLWFQY